MRRLGLVALTTAAVVTLTGLGASAALAAAPVDNNPGVQTTFGPAAPAAPAATPAPTPPADSATGSDPVSRALSLARGNRASRDLVGWQPSLYQGKWFDADVEPIRKCIMDRESNFSYTAVGAGTYFGAYQLNRGLANAATVTMEAEVRNEMGAEGVGIVKALRSIAPHRWNRYWQDRAFYTIWHKGDGKGHWRGGGLNCL